MIEQLATDKLIEAGPVVILALAVLFGLPLATWAVRAQILLFRSQQDIQRSQQKMQKEQQELEARIQLRILGEVTGTRHDLRRGLVQLIKEVSQLRELVTRVDVRDERLVTRLDMMEMRLREIATVLKIDQPAPMPDITRMPN
jgi:hypothetical protein